HRFLGEFRAIAAGETAIASGIWGRKPGALERAVGEDLRIVPQSGAHELHAPAIDARGSEALHQGAHRIGGVGYENGVGLGCRFGDTPHRFLDLLAIGGIMLETHYPAALSRRHLAELRVDDAAVGVVRY